MQTRIDSKRSIIYKAAIKVFAKYGYHSAKMSKIAEVADVAAGSIYLYYSNKEDLLMSIFSDIWSVLIANANKIVDKEDLTGMQKIDLIIDTYFEIFKNNPSLAKVYVSEHSSIPNLTKSNKVFIEQFLKIGEKVIQQGVTNKEINQNIDFNVFRYFLFGGIRNLLSVWAESPKYHSLNEISKNVKIIIKNGISV